jgi:hypothetical protein
VKKEVDSAVEESKVGRGCLGVWVLGFGYQQQWRTSRCMGAFGFKGWGLRLWVAAYLQQWRRAMWAGFQDLDGSGFWGSGSWVSGFRVSAIKAIKKAVKEGGGLCC